jgi:hypothetical protein
MVPTVPRQPSLEIPTFVHQEVIVCASRPTYRLKRLRPRISSALLLRRGLAAGDVRVIGSVLFRHGCWMAASREIGSWFSTGFDEAVDTWPREVVDEAVDSWYAVDGMQRLEDFALLARRTKSS